MATRFKHEFNSQAGLLWAICIDDDLHAGGVTAFKANGFEINHTGENGGRNTPIIGSRCQFDFILDSAAHEALMTDLVNAVEGRFTVKITREEEAFLYWCGYVLLDSVSFEDLAREGLPHCRITAMDGLGRLKDIDYAADNGSALTSYVTALDQILFILKKGGLAAKYWEPDVTFLTTSVNWWETRHGAPATAKDPLKLTRWNQIVYSDRDRAGNWKYMSCFEVLSDIMRGWNCRIMLSDGRFRVCQVNGRTSDTNAERRYDLTGALMGSSVLGHDVVISAAGGRYREKGGIFSFFPPIKKAVVEYEHKTSVNLLEGYWGHFSSVAGSPAELFDTIDLKENQSIKIAGVLAAKVTNAGPETYRIKIQLSVFLNLAATIHWLKSGITNMGNGVFIIAQDDLSWSAGTSAYVEISTGFDYSGNVQIEMPFSIWSPKLPLGAEGVSINFFGIDVEDTDGNTVFATVDSWEIKEPFLQVIDDQGQPAEETTDRIEYVWDNPAGNSIEEKISVKFGSGPRSFSRGRLQVFTDSVWYKLQGVPEEWSVGGGSTLTKQFGQLCVEQMAKGSEKAILKYSGSFFGLEIEAHKRVVFDGKEWLYIGGRFDAKMDGWSGEWFFIGISSLGSGAGGGNGPGKGKGGTTIPLPGIPPGMVGKGNGGGAGILKGNSALNLLATTKSSALIAVGAVTSVPLVDELVENAFVAGDSIFIVDPVTGKQEKVTVQTTSLDGDTSVAVTGTLVNAYPIGAVVVKDFNDLVRKSAVNPGYIPYRGYKNTTGATAQITVPQNRLISQIVVISSGSGTVKAGTTAGGENVMRPKVYSGSIPLMVDARFFTTVNQQIHFSGLSGNSKIYVYAL